MSSLLQAEQPQLSQVCVLLVLKTSYLDAALQMRSHSSEQRGRITSLALLATLLLVQPRIQLAVRAHCWLVSSCHHQHPQILFGRAVLYPFIPQFVPIVGVNMTQVQDLALGFVEPHELFSCACCSVCLCLSGWQSHALGQLLLFCTPVPPCSPLSVSSAVAEW